MADPAVEFVLDAIAQNWGTVGVSVVGHSKTIGDLSDVPLERINRDDAINLDKADGLSTLDGPVDEQADTLQATNYVGVSSTTRDDSPIGSAYDHQSDVIVQVRLEGMTARHGKYGAIDPYWNTSDAVSRDYPTTSWQNLKLNLRRSIAIERKFPQVDAPQMAFKDLFFENQSDSSSDHAHYYRWDADLRFSGFETLPDP